MSDLKNQKCNGLKFCARSCWLKDFRASGVNVVTGKEGIVSGIDGKDLEVKREIAIEVLQH